MNIINYHIMAFVFTSILSNPTLAEFKNEPVLDFSQESNRKKQAEALALIQSQLGREYDLIIGAERLQSGKTFQSINPSRKSEVVGYFQSCIRF